jgi:isoquinoline 1-oxidoreductase alpha subunit
VEIVVNGTPRQLPDELAEPALPLLWALRDLLGLTGTKFGCGVGACGACTVHVDGQAVRSCITPLSAVQGKPVVTIEALGTAGQPHRLQRAWVLHQVPQCGYCQSGLLMAAAALLARNPKPSDAEIDAAITNICRCGTYPRLRAAIRS